MDARFTIGDRVDHSPHDRLVGIVKAIYQNNPMHAGPMAMGPNTIEGDSHRQKHESIQRQQSVTRGG
jgi:hypothetical protein